MSQSSAMQSHNDSSNTADSQATAANAAQTEGTERNQRATVEPRHRHAFHRRRRPRALVHTTHRHIRAVRRARHGRQPHRTADLPRGAMAQIRSVRHRLPYRRLRLRPLRRCNRFHSRFPPHVFTSPWGALMGMLVALAISVPAALVYRRKRTRNGAMAGMALGMAIALVVALVSNLLVTPLYAHMTVAQVAAMIVPILLPFNLLKFAIHAVVTFLIYKPVTTLIDHAA